MMMMMIIIIIIIILIIFLFIIPPVLHAEFNSLSDFLPRVGNGIKP